MGTTFDSLFSIIDSIKDSFAILPLLIMGLIFFLGILTSNIGMLYLFLGHLAIVPAISFASNVPGGILRYPFDTSLFWKALKWILSSGILFTTLSVAFSSAVGTAGFSLYGILLWVFALQFFNDDMSILDTVDPSAWWRAFSGTTLSVPQGKSECGLLPGIDDSTWDKQDRKSPTSWLIHVIFFFGFVVSNAVAVYNEPVPTIPASNDPKLDETRQANLNVRVANRKSLSASIAAIAILFLLFLVIIRLRQTSCEGSVADLAIPAVYTFLIGYSWFYLIYKSCGVRPGDVLGIVQGFVTPDMADNPIVCVGSN